MKLNIIPIDACRVVVFSRNLKNLEKSENLNLVRELRIFYNKLGNLIKVNVFLCESKLKNF